jgi:hypothetical protein
VKFKVVNKSATSSHTPDRRNTEDKNWESFKLFITPKVHYDYPHERHLPDGLSFPNLRLNSAINKWTYWTLRVGSLNQNDEIVIPFTHKEMHDPKRTRVIWRTEQENEIFAHRPDHNSNLLNPALGYQPNSVDKERKNMAKGTTSWETRTQTSTSESARLTPRPVTRRGRGFSFRNRDRAAAGQDKTVETEKKEKEEKKDGGKVS